MIPVDFDGLVLFTAPWSADSCQSAKQICQTACTRSSLPFLEIIESPESEGVFDEFGVEAVPCGVRIKGGKVVGRVIGVDSQSLIKLISADISNSAVNTAVNTHVNTNISTNTSANTTANIVQLVNRSKLMIFIKGTPNEPQCGFTRQLINLLSTHNLRPNIHYDHFNILADQTIREELKKWAQWPTYPQIYWKGELLGGLDIVKEMFESGQMDIIVSELLK